MQLLRLTSAGRGDHYDALRGLSESIFRLAYAGDWPARLWGLFPVSRDVERTELKFELLPAGTAPIRVGFISDIHIGPTTPRALLDTAFEALAESQLDVLLLGGDYVYLDATPAKMELLGSLIRRVPAKLKLAVMGNHDLWADDRVIERALTEAGATVLCNRGVQLGEGVGLLGLDEPWTGKIDVAAALRDVSDPKALLVLCHSPDGVPFVEEELQKLARPRSTLFVCGHTHGGQLATPWGAPVVPGPMGKRFPRGLHTVGSMQLYVSRGVGGVEVPVRTYARPEVVVIQLEPSVVRG